MDEITLRKRLNRLLPIAEIPILEAAALDELVEIASMPDSAGRLPIAVGWIPTYNLAKAVYTGWLWKKAKAVSLVSLSGDGTTFDRNQFILHCDMMLKEYKGGVSGGALGSIRMRPTTLKSLSDISGLPLP